MAYVLVMMVTMALVASDDQVAADQKYVGKMAVSRAKCRITKTVPVKYLLYLPPDYAQSETKRWPLVVFLHGAGERGDDLRKVATHGPPRYVNEGKTYPFILVAPQCESKKWWDAHVIVELVKQITESHRVDPDRVYLTGLSMGGYGTWDAAALAPDRFAAIAPICGGGDPSRAPRLKNVAIWAFHGGNDRVVPDERSKEMVEAVNAAGGNAKLTIYPKAGHDSWTQTYENPEFFKWLLSQRRTPHTKATPPGAEKHE